MIDTKNGNSSTNSTSKIKKIRQTIKNRKENGNRALNLVENPHSNGLNFSTSNIFFLYNRFPATNISVVIRVNKKIRGANKLIILSILDGSKCDII